jgi:two-component system cell cycle response regulator DivK
MTTPESSLPSDPSPSSSLVLLVAHERDDRRRFASALDSAGFRVAEAHNGLQALQKAIDSPPDVVVTNIALPGIDGFELCRRLRRTSVTSRIPIIAVTRHFTQLLEDSGRAEQAGSDAVLLRPCDPGKLIDAIHGLLARSQKPSRKAVAALEDAGDVQQDMSTVREETRVSRDHARRLRERNDALRKIRGDYLKIPGLRMTAREGARFWNLDARICERLLESLMEEGFLTRTGDGRYKRP